MKPNQNYGKSKKGCYNVTKLLLGILLGFYGVGGGLQAASVGIFLDYADAPIANAQGIPIARNTGSVQLGAFYNQTAGAFYTTTDLTDIWSAKSKAAFDTISAAFVPLMSQNFNRATPGYFRFNTDSTGLVETEIELSSGASIDLGGKQIFVFASDSLANPANFAILAVRASLVDGFLMPAFPTGEGFDSRIDAGIEVTSSSLDAYDADLIAGNITSNQLRMEAVPSSGPVAPVVIGNPTVVHYWGSAYSDAGATSSSPVTTVIRDAGNAVVADFSAMAATLGTYSVTYTSNGSSSSRSVIVKLATPSADNDGDGLPDLMEYALGGSLTANDSAKLPTASVSGNEMILTFTARADVGIATQVAFGFISTNSLDVAFSATTLTKKSGVSAGSRSGINYETQQWSLPTTGIPKKFVRVNFTVPTELSGA
jgi:hypothetical protein